MLHPQCATFLEAGAGAPELVDLPIEVGRKNSPVKAGFLLPAPIAIFDYRDALPIQTREDIQFQHEGKDLVLAIL